jgi:hypothetical protein
METFRDGMANKRRERNLYFHIKEIHTHMWGIELNKEEEDFKQCEEVLRKWEEELRIWEE